MPVATLPVKTRPGVARAIREKLEAKRSLVIRGARESLWLYCRIMAPDFYTEERWHLRALCEALQGLFEGTLTLPDGRICRKVMLNVPPRHGKSRTLVNFCAWILGRNTDETIITASYSDDLAHDFSRFTRDQVGQIPTSAYDITHGTIFPESKLSQKGNSSYRQWALEGRHFSYKGAGVGAGITGRGCSGAIVDDPIKSAEDALNENALNRVWTWYTGTFLSRLEEGAFQIMNMTRWATGDPCGRILAGVEAADWYVIKLEAFDAERGPGDEGMLCPDLLSHSSYEERRKVMDPGIFRANYHQEPLDVRGRLYEQLATYLDWPTADDGTPVVPAEKVAYVDTADTGEDYLCCVAAWTIAGSDVLYVQDVIYTQDPYEITEIAVCDLLVHRDVRRCWIESNSGGRAFALNVRRELTRRGHARTLIEDFPQRSNKIARILTNAPTLMRTMRFPVDWAVRWPAYHAAMVSYVRMGKNVHDDAPDATTGLIEKMTSGRRAGIVNIKLGG